MSTSTCEQAAEQPASTITSTNLLDKVEKDSTNNYSQEVLTERENTITGLGNESQCPETVVNETQENQSVGNLYVPNGDSLDGCMMKDEDVAKDNDSTTYEFKRESKETQTDNEFHAKTEDIMCDEYKHVGTNDYINEIIKKKEEEFKKKYQAEMSELLQQEMMRKEQIYLDHFYKKEKEILELKNWAETWKNKSIENEEKCKSAEQRIERITNSHNKKIEKFIKQFEEFKKQQQNITQEESNKIRNEYETKISALVLQSKKNQEEYRNTMETEISNLQAEKKKCLEEFNKLLEKYRVMEIEYLSIKKTRDLQQEGKVVNSQTQALVERGKTLLAQIQNLCMDCLMKSNLPDDRDHNHFNYLFSHVIFHCLIKEAKDVEVTLEKLMELSWNYLGTVSNHNNATLEQLEPCKKEFVQIVKLAIELKNVLDSSTFPKIHFIWYEKNEIPTPELYKVVECCNVSGTSNTPGTSITVSALPGIRVGEAILPEILGNILVINYYQ